MEHVEELAEKLALTHIEKQDVFGKSPADFADIFKQTYQQILDVLNGRK